VTLWGNCPGSVEECEKINDKPKGSGFDPNPGKLKKVTFIFLEHEWQIDLESTL
jgi:hypothetical protein